MKIVCVCGMGLGSSVIAKMNIEQVLSNIGVDSTVDACDVGSIRSIQADLYVTTRELAATMPAEYEYKTLVLTNFVRKPEIEKAITEFMANK
ncbi:PTS sugar transporter subunit IIB [Vibrio fluvialis]|nr:PTS sugar transporter subunit IIB [Vibrio fluvialis]